MRNDIARLVAAEQELRAAIERRISKLLAKLRIAKSEQERSSLLEDIMLTEDLRTGLSRAEDKTASLGWLDCRPSDNRTLH